MKTIKELNEKWWYRLLKVIYIFTFVYISIVLMVTIFVGYAPQFDSQKSYIKCIDGKILNSKVLEDNDIYLNSTLIFSSEDEKITKICESQFHKWGPDVRIKDLENSLSGKKNYELVAFYTQRDWTKIIGYSFGSLLLTILSFELIKRVSYYVILGSINPNKR